MYRQPDAHPAIGSRGVQLEQSNKICLTSLKCTLVYIFPSSASSVNQNDNNNKNKKVLIAHLKFSMRLPLHMIKNNKNDKSKNAVKYRNSVLR